ncbi:hypothetical protein LguiA_013094 [Lonicera macranthoides]
MLAQATNAFSKTEGLKAKVDSFNNMFSQMESAYKALEQEHKEPDVLVKWETGLPTLSGSPESNGTVSNEKKNSQPLTSREEKNNQIPKDPWLDDDGSSMIEALAPAGMENIQEVNLIDTLFSLWDCEEILSIPVSRFSYKDRWRWKPREKGLYTIKSGCRKLAASSLPVLGPSLIPWQSVWSLNVPGKVKNFLWRAFFLSLPTKSALQARHVDIENICPLCNSEVETDIHLLISCLEVRAIWVMSSVGDQFASYNSCINWWNAIRLRASKVELEEAACLLWCIWHGKNKKIWTRKPFVANVILNMSKSTIMQWRYSKVPLSARLNQDQ